MLNASEEMIFRSPGRIIVQFKRIKMSLITDNQAGFIS